MTERFKMIGSSYLFLIKNGKILLSRRLNTGYEDGKYSLPAGHVENNESLTNAASREVAEEIGLMVKPGDFKLVHVMHRRETDIRVDYFFIAKKWKGTPVNLEPQKCSDLTWFPLNKLPADTIPYIRIAIENYQKHVFYSEIGWGSK